MTECNPNAVTNDCTGEYVHRDERNGCESWGVGYRSFLAIACFIIYHLKVLKCRSQRPRGLRHGSAAACLLGLQVRIPLGASISVSFKCCVLSGKDVRVAPITRPEESY
jgi:hypothetical protein